MYEIWNDKVTQLKLLPQRMDVYVESVQIASTEEVWLLQNWSGLNFQIKYLIPEQSIDRKSVHMNKKSDKYGNRHGATSLRLSISYPYRIEIDRVGWLLSEVVHDSTRLNNMITFDDQQVSFRVDPK